MVALFCLSSAHVSLNIALGCRGERPVYGFSGEVDAVIADNRLASAEGEVGNLVRSIMAMLVISKCVFCCSLLCSRNGF